MRPWEEFSVGEWEGVKRLGGVLLKDSNAPVLYIQVTCTRRRREIARESRRQLDAPANRLSTSSSIQLSSNKPQSLLSQIRKHKTPAIPYGLYSTLPTSLKL